MLIKVRVIPMPANPLSLETNQNRLSSLTPGRPVRCVSLSLRVELLLSLRSFRGLRTRPLYEGVTAEAVIDDPARRISNPA